MSLYGRNNKSVTANSTTTTKSTTGAPLGTFSFVKGSGRSSSPVNMDSNSGFGNTSPGSSANVDVAMFNNTTPGAFTINKVVGVYGVSPTEMSNNIANSSKERPAHAGWVLRKAGTGGIININYTGTATGYNNTDIIVVSSPQAGSNAAATISTNSTGGALVITITNSGNGFFLVNASANVFVTNDTGGATTGTGATFTALAGGRAGRVHTETLVAMGSLGAQTAQYGTPATVSVTTVDTTKYPGP